ncbi:MAG: hypothetical protein JSW63_12460 [Ignavibacterium sp.]|nr:MAG: hypothetical protein JSW63_12460 [Ignavibacterium sp.]
MMNDENKYDDVIKTLKSLQQVKAAPNFEADLKRKLNEEKYGAKSKRSIKDFLIPSRLIPSFGVAAAAIVAFLIININSEEAENPLMIEPKVREDIITVGEVELQEIPESGERSAMMKDTDKKDVVDRKNKEEKREGMYGDELLDDNIVAESESFLPESTLTDANEIGTTDDYSSPPAAGIAIRKSGLNFRQVKPTEREQKEILKLKKRVQRKYKTKEID